MEHALLEVSRLEILGNRFTNRNPDITADCWVSLGKETITVNFKITKDECR